MATNTRDGLTGSSPRGRGTHHQRAQDDLPGRFIPARAGNTPNRSIWPTTDTVHPRAGGEHRNARRIYGLSAGSSPRGRGTPSFRSTGPRHERFIPARAGNTCAGSSPARRSSVHPRAGGEHPSRSGCGQISTGSSPRGRGTLDDAIPRHPIGRFIPARAGNTPPGAPARVEIPVHPRAGGEHSARAFLPASVGGSSPRGRGTRTRRTSHAGEVRFIPARAGNTLPVT